jgi:hypothetical protein
MPEFRTSRLRRKHFSSNPPLKRRSLRSSAADLADHRHNKIMKPHRFRATADEDELAYKEKPIC